jgi:hypothetical protein
MASDLASPGYESISNSQPTEDIQGLGQTQNGSIRKPAHLLYIQVYLVSLYT